MTCRTLEAFYHIDGHTFEKQSKEVLSGFCQWEQLEHADEWLLFPYYVGPRLSIDESSLSNGEMYTFVTNHEALALALPVVQVADKSTGPKYCSKNTLTSRLHTCCAIHCGQSSPKTQSRMPYAYPTQVQQSRRSRIPFR